MASVSEHADDLLKPQSVISCESSWVQKDQTDALREKCDGAMDLWLMLLCCLMWNLQQILILMIWCRFTLSSFLSLSLCLYRYILASFYTKYDATHFLINTSSLLSVLLPKLPQFHGVRIFGINKYWDHWLNTGFLSSNTGLLFFCLVFCFWTVFMFWLWGGKIQFHLS